jgi:hypothetical protein
MMPPTSPEAELIGGTEIKRTLNGLPLTNGVPPLTVIETKHALAGFLLARKALRAKSG